MNQNSDMSAQLTAHANPYQSLYRRLLFFLGVAFLVGLVVNGTVIFYTVSQSEQQQWQARQQEAAAMATNTVSNFIERVRDSLVFVGALEQDTLLENRQPLDQILLQNDALLEAVRLDSTGQILVGAHKDSAVLENWFTIAQAQWFEDASQGKTHLSNVLFSQNVPYVIMAIPTSSGDIVAARMRMNLLWDVVAGLNFGQTGQTYVIDQTGRIVAHTDPQVALNKTSLRGQPNLDQLLAAPNQVWQGTYQNFADVHVMGTSRVVLGTDWIVITEVARSEGLATSRKTLVLLTGGTLFIMVLTLFITARVLKNLIFDPVKAVQHGTQQFRQGHLNYSINLARQDEIGQLAQAFNQMAVQLNQAFESLEERIRERTQRLEETAQAAELARKNAEAANQSKSIFLSQMSHELRTPLTGILGYVQILDRLDNKDPLISDGLTVIKKSGEHLLTLIDDLLELSRLENSASELNLSEVYFPEFLDQLVSLFELRASEKNIHFIFEADTNLPTSIIVDKNRLRRILISLLNNAVKFCHQGQITFRVLVIDGLITPLNGEKRHQQALDQKQSQLRFEVEDTGTGIEASQLENIFMPFEQAGYQNLNEEGVGLGLALTRKFVEMMGSRIRVESRVGQGSRFWFDIVVLVINGETVEPAIVEKDIDHAKAVEKIATPPPETLKTLHNLATLGKMKNVRDLMANLKDKDDQYRPFAQKIEAWAVEFEDKKIVAFIEQYLRNP